MGELHVTVINHDTILVQVDGINILTDPVFEARRNSRTSWSILKMVNPLIVLFNISDGYFDFDAVLVILITG